MYKRRFLAALAIAWLSAAAHGEQALVRFTAGFQSVACPAVCGACCGEALIHEVNGGFAAILGSSDHPITGLIDDGRFYRLSGHFYRDAGACGSGSCVFFHLDALDAARSDLEAVFDSETRTLRLPSVLVDNRDRWRVELDAPYQITQAQHLEAVRLAPQGEDCSSLDVVCSQGTTCVGYFGFAGSAGPLFQTCEIPCETAGDCPAGQQCVTVADGPGQVCREPLN